MLKDLKEAPRNGTVVDQENVDIFTRSRQGRLPRPLLK